MVSNIVVDVVVVVAVDVVVVVAGGDSATTASATHRATEERANLTLPSHSAPTARELVSRSYAIVSRSSCCVIIKL